MEWFQYARHSLTQKDIVLCIGDIFLHALELVSQAKDYYFLWGELSCYKSVCDFLFRSYSHLIMSGGLFLFLLFQPWSMSKFPHNILLHKHTERERARELMLAMFPSLRTGSMLSDSVLTLGPVI